MLRRLVASSPQTRLRLGLAPSSHVRVLSSSSSSSSSSSFDSAAMASVLDHHSHDTRDKLRALFRDEADLYRPKYNMSLDEERQLAYDRLKRLCDEKVVSVKDFWDNPKNVFATHEMAGQCDGSLSTKLTVQFNLYGGTVLKLGTSKHHDKLCDAIDDFSSVGCFGLTELGYGNNAVEMETTATYDAEADEFVINTPSTLAQKYWITNGAVHAHYCVVFARLIMPDGTDEGLHGFLVPIRSEEDLSTKEGVQVWDMGYKIGLNGIDNAALWFDNVRVPRDNLLDATASVSEDGVYTSSVEDSSPRRRKRFLVLADQLLSGRVCIASMVLGSTKICLDTTIRYALSRLAVGRTGDSDMPIMQFELQARTLMPLMARTYALNFALNHVQDVYQERTVKGAEVTDNEYEDLVNLCCIIKPLLAWHAENVATTCRERCGGQGFLSANRFGEAIVGAHAGITAEGDNKVISQKVAQQLLKHVDKAKVAEYGMMHTFRFGLVRKVIQWFRRPSGGSDVTSATWQEGVMKARADHHISSLAFGLHQRVSDKKGDRGALFDAWMMEMSDEVQATAASWGEALTMKSFNDAIDGLGPENAGLKPTLEKLRAVYAIDSIQQDAGTLLANGIITSTQVEAMEKTSRALCRELVPVVGDLAAGFGIPDWMHHAPIANNWEEYNRTQNDGELASQTYRS